MEMLLPATLDNYLDKVVAEKNLSVEDKALIKSILELPPKAREAVVNWAEKLIGEVNAQSNEQAKEDEIRALEKQKAEIQRRLDELNDTYQKRRKLTAKELSVMAEAEINEAAARNGEERV